jgi:hypothetical protein
LKRALLKRALLGRALLKRAPLGNALNVFGTRRALERTHSLAVCRSRGAESHALKIASLGSIQAGSSDHEVIEHHAIGRAAQLLEELRRSKPSGDGSQRVQLGLLIFF